MLLLIFKELFCFGLSLLFFVSTGAKINIGIQKRTNKHNNIIYGMLLPNKGEKKLIARLIPYDKTEHIVGVDACIPPQKERSGMKVNKNNKPTLIRFVTIPNIKTNITNRHLLRIMRMQYSYMHLSFSSIGLLLEIKFVRRKLVFLIITKPHKIIAIFFMEYS